MRTSTPSLPFGTDSCVAVVNSHNSRLSRVHGTLIACVFARFLCGTASLVGLLRYGDFMQVSVCSGEAAIVESYSTRVGVHDATGEPFCVFIYTGN